MLLVVLLLIGAFVWPGFLGGGSPEDVAQDYLDASADGDYEEVCDLASEKSLEEDFEEYDVDNCGDYFDALEEDSDSGFDRDELEQLQEDFDVSHELGDVDEKEETAVVSFTQTVEYTGDDESIAEAFGDSEESEGEVHLVKEDGDWKVDLDKTTDAF
ncbi:hypothetical protein [Nocardioides sp. TF02-7]|uniref:hypothetical protein n=1 Tax=Nocardioides sp. TF02-7 TaxID=2917724 RepID=UPI001F0694C5|nr:hypothetical protein [Nocardioides sp. TF02-7]UMG94536.1 hypothetical protein MF408_11555 [Nocardioides sp. TF02-7]